MQSKSLVGRLHINATVYRRKQVLTDNSGGAPQNIVLTGNSMENIDLRASVCDKNSCSRFCCFSSR